MRLSARQYPELVLLGTRLKLSRRLKRRIYGADAVTMNLVADSVEVETFADVSGSSEEAVC